MTTSGGSSGPSSPLLVSAPPRSPRTSVDLHAVYSAASCPLKTSSAIGAPPRLNQTGRRVLSGTFAASVPAPPASLALRCVIQRPPCARPTRPPPTFLKPATGMTLARPSTPPIMPVAEGDKPLLHDAGARVARFMHTHDASSACAHIRQPIRTCLLVPHHPLPTKQSAATMGMIDRQIGRTELQSGAAGFQKSRRRSPGMPSRVRSRGPCPISTERAHVARTKHQHVVACIMTRRAPPRLPAA